MTRDADLMWLEWDTEPSSTLELKCIIGDDDRITFGASPDGCVGVIAVEEDPDACGGKRDVFIGLSLEDADTLAAWLQNRQGSMLS